jgi:hypothetical protein
MRGYQNMAHDVFISYSSKDKLVADAMCAIFETNSIRCWIAPRDILPGMDWGASIIDAITDSQVMVLILSANSNASEQVKREVERAVSKGIVIIPFRIEDIQLSKTLEYHLSVTHWMDALTRPIENHIQRLADKIKPLLPEQQLDRTYQQRPEPVQAKPDEKPGTAQLTKSQQPNVWIVAIAVFVIVLLIILIIEIYLKLNFDPPKYQPLPLESNAQQKPAAPAPEKSQANTKTSNSIGIADKNSPKAEPERTHSVAEIAGKWSGLALASGGQFQIEVEIDSSCQFNQKCGTISVSNVPCYGEIFLKQANNGVYEFHVDNFDSRSDLKNCQAGAGEYFRLLEDGNLSYSTSYSDATATLEKTGT